ncbi:hypothetical protein CAAN1_07S01574 [[Candida] anglica]|uniref:Nucleoporin Nup120/160 beta-propeller domain-containing protein n=1 Tax=[Candida] anglica TaxID=148631 RepID=A0ABP0EAZ2_9ASCO
MVTSHTETAVTGYADHLPTLSIRLPLKYGTLSKNNNINNNNEKFHLNLANSGQIIALDSIPGSFIDAVSWSILNDFRTIKFTPLITQANSLDLSFQQLEVNLPHPVSSANCLSVYLQRGVTEEDDSFLLLDVIDENYLFTSLKISLNDFVVIENKSSPKPFQLDKFNQWGHISVPYSFELRSPPYSLKAVSEHSLIVSLKDGGLLHFHRNSPLNDYDVHNFNESSSMNLLPFSFISGIWKGKKDNNSDNEASSASIVVGGVSANSVVDVIPVSADTIVTICVNKVLKIWSLNTHQQVQQAIDLKENPRDTSYWLSTSATVTRHLQIVKNKYTDKTYLTCYYTTKPQDINGSTFALKIWEIVDQGERGIDLFPLDSLSFNPTFPQASSKSTTVLPAWLVQDFQARITHQNTIEYHILWKTNTSSLVSVYTLDLSLGNITNVSWSSSPFLSAVSTTNSTSTPSSSSNVLSTFSAYHSANYYSDKILNSGIYDDLTVRTSLAIFREHVGLGDRIPPASLRQSILEAVKVPEHENDTRLGWYKLDSLCEEFKKLSEECLAICLGETNTSNGFILNSNSVSILRPSHTYEQFFLSTPEVLLASVLKRLSIIVSTKTYIKVYEQLVSTQSLSESGVTDIYNSLLKSKIPKEESDAIINELVNTPGMLDAINGLVNGDSTFKSSNDISDITTSTSIGSLTKLAAVASFKQIKTCHESILLGLAILLLIMEVNDPLLEIINLISSRLSTYKLLNAIFDTSFESSHKNVKVERHKLSNIENSLFWTGIVSKSSTLHKSIMNGEFIEAYNILFDKIVNDYENMTIDVIIQLINHDEGELIKSNFVDKLNSTNTVDRFLIGFVHLISNDPTKFYEVFQSEMDLSNTKVKLELQDKILQSLTANSNIKTFLNSLFDHNMEDPLLEKANYYHSLSILASSQVTTAQRQYTQKFITPIATTFLASSPTSAVIESDFTKGALKFEQTAILSLQELPTSDEVEGKIVEYYLNVFDMALNLGDYDLVYQALSYLASVKNPNDKFELKDLFTKFINNLITNRSISIIFPSTTGSSHPRKLFYEFYLLIDSILLGLANNELTLSNSLKYYEYLYSWRLFGGSSDYSSINLADKRGATEALYIFITRFRYEQNLLTNNESMEVDEDVKQYKLKILELYMIILNCLKSFENEEDQWLIKSQNLETLCVITLSELKEEYSAWLKELETDMKLEYI